MMWQFRANFLLSDESGRNGLHPVSHARALQRPEGMSQIRSWAKSALCP